MKSVSEYLKSLASNRIIRLSILYLLDLYCNFIMMLGKIKYYLLMLSHALLYLIVSAVHDTKIVYARYDERNITQSMQFYYANFIPEYFTLRKWLQDTESYEDEMIEVIFCSKDKLYKNIINIDEMEVNGEFAVEPLLSTEHSLLVA